MQENGNYTDPNGTYVPSILTFLTPGKYTCQLDPQRNSYAPLYILVEAAAASERFCVKNGEFVSYAERGGKLTYSSSKFYYTDNNGVQYVLGDPALGNFYWPTMGGTATSRFGYGGQLLLSEASLYHYKARAYDPLLGRFAMQMSPSLEKVLAPAESSPWAILKLHLKLPLLLDSESLGCTEKPRY